jgi:hypothetical protein
MRESGIYGNNASSADICATIAELKLRIAEHIVDRQCCPGFEEMRDILTETKVGARRKPALFDILKKVFSAA